MRTGLAFLVCVGLAATLAFANPEEEYVNLIDEFDDPEDFDDLLGQLGEDEDVGADIEEHDDEDDYHDDDDEEDGEDLDAVPADFVLDDLATGETVRLEDGADSPVFRVAMGSGMVDFAFGPSLKGNYKVAGNPTVHFTKKDQEKVGLSLKYAMESLQNMVPVIDCVYEHTKNFRNGCKYCRITENQCATNLEAIGYAPWPTTIIFRPDGAKTKFDGALKMGYVKNAYSPRLVAWKQGGKVHLQKGPRYRHKRTEDLNLNYHQFKRISIVSRSGTIVHELLHLFGHDHRSNKLEAYSKGYFVTIAGYCVRSKGACGKSRCDKKAVAKSVAKRGSPNLANNIQQQAHFEIIE
mmetsp:Transcript_64606/g.97346  ORF Transcript_64606/g.97346 Transcript_64606/m.97346 type:complete len:351 (-) Transcript_64606:24-1076(-)